MVFLLLLDNEELAEPRLCTRTHTHTTKCVCQLQLSAREEADGIHLDTLKQFQYKIS